MKELSCGIVITDGMQVLSIIPSNKPRKRDLPKGHIDKGETTRQCAHREVWEETGLRVPDWELIDLGRFDYRPSKDLHLYAWITPKLPPIESMKCNSFYIEKGKHYPEALGFEYIAFDDFKFYRSLLPILKSIQDMIRV